MKHEKIYQYRQAFEAAAHREQDIDFWLARDLQRLLGYTEWRNFLQVVGKAASCVGPAMFV